MIPALYVASTVAGGYCCYRFLAANESPRTVKIAYKCIPTLCTAVLAFIAAVQGSATGLYVMASGLAMCMLADAALEVSFVPAVVLFACAHIGFACYFASYSAPFLPRLAGFTALTSFISVMVLRLKRTHHIKSPELLIVYGFVLSAMFALSIGTTIPFVAGALLFTLSDILLGLRLIGLRTIKYSGIFVMVLYYSALYLFALGCILS